MSNTGERILPVSRYYDSLNGMKRKYDRLARQEAFFRNERGRMDGMEK